MRGPDELLSDHLRQRRRPQGDGQRLRPRACPLPIPTPIPERRPTASPTNMHQDALSYGCICGNGKQPNMSEFTLTLPYHTCTEYGNQCVDDCPDHDNDCARACREDNLCGAQDPQKPSGTVDAAKPKATDEDEDEDEVFEGMAGDDDKGDAGRVEVGKTYGTVVVLGALFAGFAML